MLLGSILAPSKQIRAGSSLMSTASRGQGGELDKGRGEGLLEGHSRMGWDLKTKSTGKDERKELVLFTLRSLNGWFSVGRALTLSMTNSCFHPVLNVELVSGTQDECKVYPSAGFSRHWVE